MCPRAPQKGGGIRSNNTTVVTDPETGHVTVTLHSTKIAVFKPADRSCDLNTGGYCTPTTIRRMNECLATWGFRHRITMSDFKTSNTLTIAVKP